MVEHHEPEHVTDTQDQDLPTPGDVSPVTSSSTLANPEELARRKQHNLTSKYGFAGRKGGVMAIDFEHYEGKPHKSTTDNQLVSRVIANEDSRNWVARRLAPMGLSRIMALVVARMNQGRPIPPTRQQPYVLMRGVIVTLAREVGYSYPLIATALGIHHTTAIHALGRVREELAAGNAQLIKAMHSIREGLR